MNRHIPANWRILWRRNTRVHKDDAATLDKYARGQLSTEQAIAKLSYTNQTRITEEQLLANIIWLGYANVYTKFHGMTNKYKYIYSTMTGVGFTKSE